MISFLGNSQPNVLMLTQVDVIRERFSKIFEALNVYAHFTTDLRQIIEILVFEEIDTILLDSSSMPLSMLSDFFRNFNQSARDALDYTPVVVVGEDNPEYISRSYQAGCADYIRFRVTDTEIQHRLLARLRFRKLQDAYFQRMTELESAKRLIEEKNRKLEKLTVTDDLTGLYNRRHIRSVLQYECARFDRYGYDLSVLMIDLDHFKQVNDTYGHYVGDQVLKEFSNRLERSTRITDVCSRFGGEEFIVVAPNGSLQDARLLAKKILHLVQERSFLIGEMTLRLTVSIGIASLLSHSPSCGAELIDLADKALYLAKQNGRGRVEEPPEGAICKLSDSQS